MVTFGYRVSKMSAFSPCRRPKVTWRQEEFLVSAYIDIPKWTEKRDFSQYKELLSPCKKRLENRATSQEEGEDLAGLSSAEDTVSNIL